MEDREGNFTFNLTESQNFGGAQIYYSKTLIQTNREMIEYHYLMEGKNLGMYQLC